MRDKQIVERMKEIRELLAEFGLTLSGYEPGVSAFITNKPRERGEGYAGEPINLDRNEWIWLEPLLKELREKRDLHAHAAEYKALLAELVDPDDCWFDHHGYCQAHGWLQEGECPHARAKKALEHQQ